MLFGDGSKPWYLVNPKIADEWMFIKCIYRYWPIPIYEYLLYNLSGVYSMHRTHPSSSCPICHNPFNKRGVFTQMHNLVSTMVNQMILINIHTSPYLIYPDLHQTNWGRNHIGLRLKHIYFYQGPNGCSVCFSLPTTIYYVQQTWKLNGSFIYNYFWISSNLLNPFKSYK